MRAKGQFFAKGGSLFGWAGLLIILLFFMGYLLFPYLLERFIHNGLADAGYQEITMGSMAWSGHAGGIKLDQLQAAGEGLPHIDMGETEVWLDPVKLLLAEVEIQWRGRIFSGDVTMQLSNDLWHGTGRIRASLEGVSLAALSGVASYLMHGSPDPALAEGRLWLELKGNWQDNLNTMPGFTADIRIEEIKLAASLRYPAAGIEALTIKQLEYHPDEAKQPPVTVGEVLVEELKIPNMSLMKGKHRFPVTVAQLQLHRFQLPSEKRLSFEHLEVSGVQAGIDSRPLVNLAGLNIKGAKWQSDKGVSFESVALKKGEVKADIDAQGQWSDWKLWLAQLSSAGGVESSAVARGDRLVPALSIADMNLSEIQIDFTDESKKPVVRMPMFIAGFSARNVVVNREVKPFSWQANGLAGRQGKWLADGRHSADRSDGQLRIESLELSPLSGYVASSYGKGVRSGNLDLNLSVSVQQGMLKAEGDLFARKLSLSSIKGVQGSTGNMVPLESALEVLKDGDDNVTLHFLSEGRLDDPSFKLNGIWDKALSKAASSSVLYMLAQALQPYALVVPVGEFLYDQSKRIPLKPILFEQGEAAVEHAQPDIEGYAQKIAGLLRSKNSLVLEVCPRYTQAEIENGEKLSLQRSALLIERLFKLGLPATQVTSCLPELDAAKKARPRLDLRLI